MQRDVQAASKLLVDVREHLQRSEVRNKDLTNELDRIREESHRLRSESGEIEKLRMEMDKLRSERQDAEGLEQSRADNLAKAEQKLTV